MKSSAEFCHMIWK